MITKYYTFIINNPWRVQKVICRMNKQQKMILQVIKGILSVDNISDYLKDSVIRYGFLNYIAKYSLASDRYFVTPRSLKFIQDKGYLLNGELRRSLKSKKNGFTYEHPIPANVIGNIIIKSERPVDVASKILKVSDCVTILTHEENAELSKRLRSKMPDGWSWQSDEIFARYFNCNIVKEKPKNTIKMIGSIVR